MNRRATLLVLAAMVAVLTVVSVASAGSGIDSFKTPGGKVKCIMYTEPGLPYDVLCITALDPGVAPFPHPRCEAGDPGGGLVLALKGRAKGICLSEDPIITPPRVLRYGKRIESAGLSCKAVSKAVGIRCTNPAGHGFEMSPSRWRRF